MNTGPRKGQSSTRRRSSGRLPPNGRWRPQEEMTSDVADDDLSDMGRLSESSEEEIQLPDSEEHMETSARTPITEGPLSSSLSPLWKDFTTQIKGIEIDKECFQDKPLTNKSSELFREVMTEIQEEKKKRKTRREGIKNAIRLSVKLRSMAKKRAEERELEEEAKCEGNDDKGVQEGQEEEGDDKLTLTKRMSRGWKLLSRNFQEQHLEKKKQADVSTGWNLLIHAVKHMTDEEKARQVLYERYLNKTDFWAEGLVNYPQFLLERRQKGERVIQNGRTARPSTALGNTRPKAAAAHSNDKVAFTNGHATPMAKSNSPIGRGKRTAAAAATTTTQLNQTSVSTRRRSYSGNL